MNIKQERHLYQNHHEGWDNISLLLQNHDIISKIKTVSTICTNFVKLVHIEDTSQSTMNQINIVTESEMFVTILDLPFLSLLSQV